MYGTTKATADDKLPTRPELIVWDLQERRQLQRWTVRSGVA